MIHARCLFYLLLCENNPQFKQTKLLKQDEYLMGWFTVSHDTSLKCSDLRSYILAIQDVIDMVWVSGYQSSAVILVLIPRCKSLHMMMQQRSNALD